MFDERINSDSLDNWLWKYRYFRKRFREEESLQIRLVGQRLRDWMETVIRGERTNVKNGRLLKEERIRMTIKERGKYLPF